MCWDSPHPTFKGVCWSLPTLLLRTSPNNMWYDIATLNAKQGLGCCCGCKVHCFGNGNLMFSQKQKKTKNQFNKIYSSNEVNSRQDVYLENSNFSYVFKNAFLEQKLLPLFLDYVIFKIRMHWFIISTSIARLLKQLVIEFCIMDVLIIQPITFEQLFVSIH